MPARWIRAVIRARIATLAVWAAIAVIGVRTALAGTPRAYVIGSPAIQHDLEPILASDLHRGEAIARRTTQAIFSSGA